jgi:hypothetical protein
MKDYQFSLHATYRAKDDEEAAFIAESMERSLLSNNDAHRIVSYVQCHFRKKLPEER